MSEINIPFAKMNGAGNQIVVADVRDTASKITADAAIAIDQNPRTKFDQLMEISDNSIEDIDANIRIFNCDGSSAEACGNGMRCVVSYLHKLVGKKDYLFKTPAGLLSTKYTSEDEISIFMGIPKFEWDEIPLEEEFGDTTGIELQVGPIDEPTLHTPSVANIGNPHCVFWVEDDVMNYNLEQIGSLLTYHPRFPQGANITLAKVETPDHIIIRTYERGAGITQACGSAACASLVCAVRKEFSNRKAKITVPGGDLFVEWDENDRVYLSGPAQFEFDGLLDATTGELSFEDA